MYYQNAHFERDVVNTLLEISEQDINFHYVQNKPSISHIFQHQVQQKPIQKLYRPVMQKSQNTSLQMTIEHDSSKDLTHSPKKRNSRSLQVNQPRMRNHETQTLDMNQSICVRSVNAEENCSQIMESSKKFLPLQNNSKIRLLISQQKKRQYNQFKQPETNQRIRQQSNDELKEQIKLKLAQYAHTQDLLIIQKLKTFKIQTKPQSLTTLKKMTNPKPVKLLQNSLISRIYPKYYEDSLAKNSMTIQSFEKEDYKKIHPLDYNHHRRSESQNLTKLQESTSITRSKYTFETLF